MPCFATRFCLGKLEHLTPWGAGSRGRPVGPAPLPAAPVPAPHVGVLHRATEAAWSEPALCVWKLQGYLAAQVTRADPLAGAVAPDRRSTLSVMFAMRLGHMPWNLGAPIAETGTSLTRVSSEGLRPEASAWSPRRPSTVRAPSSCPAAPASKQGTSWFCPCPHACPPTSAARGCRALPGEQSAASIRNHGGSNKESDS